MRIVIMAIVIVCMSGLAGLGFANDKDPREEKRFSNETSLSLVNTTGNTDSLSLAGTNDMKYKFSKNWTGSWVVGAIYNETSGVKEAERYFTDLRADYTINERWYAYGLGGWLRDEFAGFDNRIFIGPGVGYKFLIGPRHFLTGEGGVNYAYEDYTDPAEGNNEFPEGRLFGLYEWAFTDKTKFSQGLEYLQSFQDIGTWKLNSDTSLTVAMTETIALKVSYLIFYNNEPRPSTLDNTDTIFATSLVITY